MGKKCIPGVICIENMTLFLLIVIVVFMMYFYAKMESKIVVIQQPSQPLQSLGNNASIPVSDGNNASIPVSDGNNASIPVLDGQTASLSPPVNRMYMTQSSSQYTQVGILTRTNDLILPLMGRRTGRHDKMQYYTMSNTGPINTKLPISKNGKSCTGEYGCDEITNGDTVFVEGYSDTFKATVYESGQFSYNPTM
jgi:hypothetical protein